ncbi:cytochrome b5-like [Schistocerca cancellata]|uniref:cytochrome b5-like n=1 Tax=Schistocerca cancellata TaxID=274614 RepID=UPI002117402D|nr:cytochrome b5-like [Schistocerca cancellata]
MEEPVKLLSMAEVAKCKERNRTVMVINNAVYDITAFLDDHPGGAEILIEQAGKDATDVFEDVGHSTDAKELMEKYKIGELVEEDRVQRTAKPSAISDTGNETNFSYWKLCAVSVALVAVATVLYRAYYIEKGH